MTRPELAILKLARRNARVYDKTTFERRRDVAAASIRAHETRQPGETLIAALRRTMSDPQPDNRSPAEKMFSVARRED